MVQTDLIEVQEIEELRDYSESTLSWNQKNYNTSEQKRY